MKKIKLNLEKLFLTSGVVDLVEENILNAIELEMNINRFSNCDFSESEFEEDIAANMEVIENECGRVLGEYTIGGEKIWIIHYFADEDSYTTILLPSEY